MHITTLLGVSINLHQTSYLPGGKMLLACLPKDVFYRVGETSVKQEKQQAYLLMTLHDILYTSQDIHTEILSIPACEMHELATQVKH